MNLNEVHRGIKKNKPRRRIGRGPGSGHGKTAGRGHKGQASRAGASNPISFQGGSMPLFRRIPKRGFNNKWALTVVTVNVEDLENNFQDGDDITPDTLKTKRMVGPNFDISKILGNGDLTKKLKVSAHRFSKSAVEKIEKAGGTVTVLPGKKPVVKNKQKSSVAK